MTAKTPMMKCGHAANAKDGNGNWVCVICFGIATGYNEIDEDPDLTNREAQCPYCKMVVPSKTTLAFFEYRGEGSVSATEMCALCPYRKSAHGKSKPNRAKIDHEFEPHGPYEYDSYYCGCRGWN